MATLRAEPSYDARTGLAVRTAGERARSGVGITAERPVAAVAGLMEQATVGSNAVRRLPVVDGGRFVGMLSLDDLLVELADDLAGLVRPIAAEAIFGHHDAPVPATVARA